MKFSDKYLQSSLASVQGPTLYNQIEIANLRKKAWSEQCLLIISPLDEKLEQSEKLSIIKIAERIYGEAGEE